LKQGIKGEPIGRWPPVTSEGVVARTELYEERLKELNRFESIGLSKEVKIEFERLILKEWLEKGLADNAK
jgi:hypothetical protein